MILSLAMSLALNQASPSEIAENIKELNPRIHASRAKYLSKIIYKEADRYGLDPNIITAILKQESNFEPKKVCYTVRRKGVDVPTCDHGISQINSAWAQRWNLDPDILTQDDALNIHTAARVLSIIEKQFDEKNFWSRYNTSVKSKRNVYEVSVTTYLEKIE